MTAEFILTLTLRAPLALHQTRAGVQYVETLDYVPGTALRGALAKAYLAEQGSPDSTFRALFLSDQVQYGDLWPTIEGKPTTLIPATVQVCKRYKFAHGDSLRDALFDALSSQPAAVNCKCGEALDRASGYLCSLNPVESLSPRSRLRVSTAIERSTGTAARELLFTQHTLIGRGKVKGREDNKRDDSENTVPLLFQGTLRLTNPALYHELAGLLKPTSVLFLGAGRSRGLGEVEVKTCLEAPADQSLPDRWKKFNEAAQRTGGDPDTRYFSLTLLSHLALRDELLRPVLSDITPQHFGLPETVTWARYPNSEQPVLFLNTVTFSGWNAALGLPKPDTVALARGSVLLGQCPASEEQTILTRLAKIEAEGVGERRNEGFGRVAICYPIHYERWR